MLKSSWTSAAREGSLGFWRGQRGSCSQPALSYLWEYSNRIEGSWLTHREEGSKKRRGGRELYGGNKVQEETFSIDAGD